MNANEPGETARVDPTRLAGSPGFASALADLAREPGRDEATVARQAHRYLNELRTSHSPAVYAWLVRAGRALLGSGYSRIDYDDSQVARVRALLAGGPAVVLSSHKSYLDGGALTVGFHDRGLPPLTVFGGINMAFWPLGSLWRRADMVFIRRGGDDPVYRCTLRHYLADLVSRRRPLQWFIEGTRSRTGKLGPPRVGLLAYLVEAWSEGRIEDLALLPVSVSYERLQEVAEYSGEARGAAKTAESLAWLVRFVRAQRGSFGAVYVRFGEPLSLRASLGPPEGFRSAGQDERKLALQKLAFGVCCGINDATPLTGTSLVTLALLGARGRSLTLAQIRAAVAGYVDFARRRDLPLAASAALDSDDAVTEILEGLVAQGVATAHSSGSSPVFGIAPEQHLAAAYYRNTIVHHFLDASIAELALLRAAREPPERRLAAFEEESLELRDVLKFDFFFRDRHAFLQGVAVEIDRLAPDWRTRLAEGPGGVEALLERAPTLSSDMLLRSFVEAYWVVADALAGHEGAHPPDESAFLERCVGLGRQYLLQGRLRSPEAVSLHLFRSGVQLAKNRGLWTPGEAVQERRAELGATLLDVLRRLSAVHRVAVARVERAIAGRGDPRS